MIITCNNLGCLHFWQPENIFVDHSSLEAFLGDFGSSVVFSASPGHTVTSSHLHDGPRVGSKKPKTSRHRTSGFPAVVTVDEVEASTLFSQITLPISDEQGGYGTYFDFARLVAVSTPFYTPDTEFTEVAQLNFWTCSPKSAAKHTLKELAAADVWSLGEVLYSVVTGAPVAWLELFGEHPRLALPAHMSSSCADLLCAMLQSEDWKRPTLDAVLSHPWFKVALVPAASQPSRLASVATQERIATMIPEGAPSPVEANNASSHGLERAFSDFDAVIYQPFGARIIFSGRLAVLA